MLLDCNYYISDYTMTMKCDNLLISESFPYSSCFIAFNSSPILFIPVKSRLVPIVLDSSVEGL
jgi:hypothetical protein